MLAEKKSIQLYTSNYSITVSRSNNESGIQLSFWDPQGHPANSLYALGKEELLELFDRISTFIGE
jgi:hypothetical protein